MVRSSPIVFHVASAPDPFANAASGLVSKDATTAFTPVLLDIPNGDVTEEIADRILDTTEPARKAGDRRECRRQPRQRPVQVADRQPGGDGHAQHHAAGEPPRQAVRSGVASSARVIAAAAIIMIGDRVPDD